MTWTERHKQLSNEVTIKLKLHNESKYKTQNITPTKTRIQCDEGINKAECEERNEKK